MKNNLDPETLKIPAYLRKKAIVSQAKQKLILTALDRKEAGLKPNSTRALAPIKKEFARSTRSNYSVSSSSTQRSKDPVRSNAFKNTLRKIRTPRSIPTQTSFETPLFDSPLQQEFTRDDSPYPSSRIGQENSVRFVPEEPTFIAEDFPPKFFAMGTITHYLANINVAIIKLTGTLKQNDLILIANATGLFLQRVEEMQIDRNPVKKAQNGAHIGLKVREPVQVNGQIFKVG